MRTKERTESARGRLIKKKVEQEQGISGGGERVGYPGSNSITGR